MCSICVGPVDYCHQDNRTPSGLLAVPGEPLARRQAETLGAPLVRSNHAPLHYRLLVSDESLDPALTAHSHTPRHCRVSRHYFTRLVVTHTRSSHIQSTAVARPRDTTAASWTSRHPTVSRPRARLPTYLLLASYGAIGRSEWCGGSTAACNTSKRRCAGSGTRFVGPS